VRAAQKLDARGEFFAADVLTHALRIAMDEGQTEAPK
jgi:hypothetical protein